MNDHESLRNLWNKLKRPEYRKGYVNASLTMSPSDQIRKMRKDRGWTQAYLARQCGVSRQTITQFENNVGKTYMSLKTLNALANAFDVGISAQFVPFSEMIKREELHTEEKINSFEDDQFVFNNK